MAFLQGQEGKYKGESSVSYHNQNKSKVLVTLQSFSFEGVMSRGVVVLGQFRAEVVT